MPEKYISKKFLVITAHQSGQNTSFNMPGGGLFNSSKGDYVGDMPKMQKDALPEKEFREKYVEVKKIGEPGDLAISLLSKNEKGETVTSTAFFINPNRLNFRISFVQDPKKDPTSAKGKKKKKKDVK